MKGKVAVMSRIHEPLEMREYDVPELGPDDILVKVRMSNICGSDLHLWHGKGPRFNKLPVVLGHECVGTVAALGKNVTTDMLGNHLSEGDRIVYSYFKPCGQCWMCARGDAPCPNRNVDWIGISSDDPPHFNGSFGEFHYLRRGHWVFKVADDLPDHIVSSVNCVFSQAFYGAHKIGVRVGDTVVIQGAGGLGLYLTAIAKERGAERVVVIDRLRQRLDLAKEFGADETLNAAEADSEQRIAAVQEMTNGLGADIVIEVAGTPAVVGEGIQLLRMGGRYLWMGNITEGTMAQVDTGAVVRRALTIMGVIAYEAWVIPKVFEFIRRTRHKYPLDKIISHTFTFEQINEALNFAEQGKGIRVAIVF